MVFATGLGAKVSDPPLAFAVQLLIHPGDKVYVWFYYVENEEETMLSLSELTSSDEEVVSVSSSLADPQTATLEALKAGTATITVTATPAAGGGVMPRTGGETFTASCTITVKEKEKVTLDQTELTLKQGETGKLTATVNTEAQIIWYSDDIRVARVDENGNVLAVGAGTAVITAETPNGTKASCTVKVQAHDLILVDAKAPTCTEDGHCAYYRCEVC